MDDSAVQTVYSCYMPMYDICIIEADEGIELPYEFRRLTQSKKIPPWY